MAFEFDQLFHAVSRVGEDALHGRSSRVRKHLAQSVQLPTNTRTHTNMRKSSSRISVRSLPPNSRDELIDGGEFWRGSEGQLSDVLQKKSKQFLRKQTGGYFWQYQTNEQTNKIFFWSINPTCSLSLFPTARLGWLHFWVLATMRRWFSGV